MNPILTLENVALGYSGKRVLTDISFSAFPGELISVAGPNGSGKTTLLKAMTKIIKPEKGNICLHGRNITDISSKELARKIAVTRQSPQAPAMTVEEYVLLGRLPFFRKYQFFETEKDLSAARKYMELTGILHLEKNRVDEISEGERQLASMARALCQEPALLLLDEPTSNLDIARQAAVLELIHRLKQTLSIAVIMVIHDLNLASEYSDRMIMLSRESGGIYLMGTPGETLTEKSVRDVYHAEVTVSSNPVSGKPRLFINRSGIDHSGIDYSGSDQSRNS